jgi:hypothetical protein
MTDTCTVGLCFSYTDPLLLSIVWFALNTQVMNNIHSRIYLQPVKSTTKGMLHTALKKHYLLYNKLQTFC